MINWNDLIGLQYKFGTSPEDGSGFTDCFSLCMEVRKRLGLKLLRRDFQWVYDEYSETTLTTKQILKWFTTYGEIITSPRPGAIFGIPHGAMMFPMAVVASEGDCLFISPGKMVVAAPLSLMAPSKFFWAD